MSCQSDKTSEKGELELKAVFLIFAEMITFVLACRPLSHTKAAVVAVGTRCEYLRDVRGACAEVSAFFAC